MILVVSYDGDETGDAVVGRLESSGASFIRLDGRCLASDCWYAIEPLSDGLQTGQIYRSFRMGDDEVRVEGEQFDTVYWRRPYPFSEALGMSYPDRVGLAGMEAFHALRLSVYGLPDSFFPLGHPARMDLAANKIRQLHLAKRFGFSVPDTIIGNDPDALSAFLSRHEYVVVKPVQANAVFATNDRSRIERRIWCRGMEREALREKLDPTKASQLMLQEAVIKGLDWRITVLPHTTICCEIETSSREKGDLDWRRGCMGLPHRIVDVPSELDAMMRSYLEELGLKAGYFDFGIGSHGTPVFFEVNTNAEWYWIEELTGEPISEEVAKCLRREV